MVVHTKSVQFTGGGTRQVELANPGTADLHWSIFSNATWLHLSPLSGTIQPGKTGSFTITSDTSELSHDATVQAYVQVTAIGLPAQSIPVTMQFLTGLNNVTIQGALKDFALDQGITNRRSTQINADGHRGLQHAGWTPAFRPRSYQNFTGNFTGRCNPLRRNGAKGTPLKTVKKR